MSFTERIEQDLKEAMKARREAELSTLRLARSALKNKQIEVQHELSDEEVLSVLRTLVKQYKDALSDFTQAGRRDLAEKQAQEIALLEKYLPAAMPESELRAICERVIREQNATSKDIGKVMGLVMKEINGRADGNTVRAIVQDLFSRALS